jgi:uncharacterized protein YjdB
MPKHYCLLLLISFLFAGCSSEGAVEEAPEANINLDKTQLTLAVGESETIKAIVSPDNAKDKTVTWTTSDAAVATVDGGKVTAVKEGNATITAKVGNKSANSQIWVVPKSISGGHEGTSEENWN